LSRRLSPPAGKHARVECHTLAPLHATLPNGLLGCRCACSSNLHHGSTSLSRKGRRASSFGRVWCAKLGILRRACIATAMRPQRYDRRKTQHPIASSHHSTTMGGLDQLVAGGFDHRRASHPEERRPVCKVLRSSSIILHLQHYNCPVFEYRVVVVIMLVFRSSRRRRKHSNIGTVRKLITFILVWIKSYLYA
jgi:hypothetical protein